MLLDSECITVTDDKGVDITKTCDIETTDQSFIIKTRRNLEPGQWLRVTYRAEADKSLAGKEVENTAAASADNADPVQDDHTVIIDPLPDVPAETEPPSDPDRQEGLTLNPDKEKRHEGLKLSKGDEPKTGGGTVQTGDDSSMMLYVLLANIAAVVLILCMLGRRKHKHR